MRIAFFWKNEAVGVTAEFGQNAKVTLMSNLESQMTNVVFVHSFVSCLYKEDMNGSFCYAGFSGTDPN